MTVRHPFNMWVSGFISAVALLCILVGKPLVFLINIVFAILNFVMAVEW
jgi:hypothetical protein